eukprot:s371_g5.t1
MYSTHITEFLHGRCCFQTCLSARLRAVAVLVAELGQSIKGFLEVSEAASFSVSMPKRRKRQGEDRSRKRALHVPEPFDLFDAADLPSVLPQCETKEEAEATETAPEAAEFEAAAVATETAETAELEAKDLEQADEEATLNGIGELAILRRFLRLWQASEAWNRRLVRELLSWSVGQPAAQLPVHEEDACTSLGTPAWARPSGALYRAAAATSSSSHILSNKKTKKKQPGSGKTAAEMSSEEVSSDSDEPRVYRPGDWPDEVRHLEILEASWPKYLCFRKARKLFERPPPNWQSVASLDGVERELSIRSLFAQAGHRFETSEWHCLICRLLLCLHNSAELFAQVQLPFVLRQYLGLPAAVDLWQETTRFLRMSSMSKESEDALLEMRPWVETLRKSSVSLINAAPRIWQCIFESSKSSLSRRASLEKEVKHALESSESLHHFDSVFTGLLYAYAERLGQQIPKREDLLAPLAPKERRLICRILGISFRSAPQGDTPLLRLLQKRLQAPVQSADDCERLRSDEVPGVATLRMLLQEYSHWENFKPTQTDMTEEDFLLWLCPRITYRAGRYQDICRKLLQEGRELSDEKSGKVFESRELVALKDYLLRMELPTEFNVAEYVYADGEQEPEHRIVLPTAS